MATGACGSARETKAHDDNFTLLIHKISLFGGTVSRGALKIGTGNSSYGEDQGKLVGCSVMLIVVGVFLRGFLMRRSVTQPASVGVLPRQEQVRE